MMVVEWALLVGVVFLVAVAVIYFWLLPMTAVPSPTARRKRSPLDPGASGVNFTAFGQEPDDEADPSDASVEGRLTELESLRQRGLVTGAEYKSRRRELTGRR